MASVCHTGHYRVVNQDLSDWLDSVAAGCRARVEPLPPAASYRRFYRLWDTANVSRICMWAPPPNEDSSRFVTLARRLHTAGLPVPEIEAHEPVSGFVLMSDLGGRNLEAAYAAGEEDRAVEIAIEQLHLLQTLPPGEVPPYDRQRLEDELDIFSQWYVEGTLGEEPPAQWPALRERMAAEIIRQPTVVVHRDYHCQNLLLSPEGSFGIVDFQDALAGPALYDLASLLRDCYHRFSEGDISRHLHTYLQRTPLEIPEPERSLNLTALQRQLKAVGIFARLKLRDDKDSHLKYIQPVLEHAEFLAAGLDGYEALADWLQALRGSQP